MGAYFLTDLADVCRRTGYPVIEVDDWHYRSRGSGGYDGGRPNHVMVHHTASGPESDGWPDVNYCTFGDDDAPLCNLYLARDGTIYVCAGGATNTNGSGEDPCGATADDNMNASAIGIEAGNAGTGEPWSGAQQNAYVELCAALCGAYAIGADQVHGHAEYTSRKIDPAGESSYADGGDTWNMDAFRDDVAGGPFPEPEPIPPLEDDVMICVFESQSEPREFNAMFFATCDGQGRSIELQWSGNGDDPAVQERIATMLANFGPARPLTLGGVRNNRLHPKHRPSDLVDSLHVWTDSDFAP